MNLIHYGQSFLPNRGNLGHLIKNAPSHGGGRYRKKNNTVASLGHVFNNRRIRFVITCTIIEIEELGLMVGFLSDPNCPRGPGQFGSFSKT